MHARDLVEPPPDRRHVGRFHFGVNAVGQKDVDAVRLRVEPERCPGEACVTEINQPGVKALAQALETVWGRPPVYKREGGSIPVVVDMRKILGIESVLTGFGLPDDNLHAPNEKLHLPTWYKGIEALIQFFYNLNGSEGTVAG